MTTRRDCSECSNHDYCEHTSMYFCKVNMSPAWMAHAEFYDKELDECSHKSGVKQT